jgi:hypothetical protein
MRGTHQTSSSVEGAVDCGAFAGRGGRVRGKGRRGARRLLKPERERGEKKWGGGGSRVNVRVGAGEETRTGAGAVVDSTGGRQWPGHGTHGQHGTVRTGERRGPLTFGPWPAAGERGRGGQRGMWAGPGEREMGRARRNRKIFDLFK